MAHDSDNSSRIEAASSRARRRWLVSAMINAGGRWAVLPGGLVALVGIVLALAGVRSLPVLLPLVAGGLVGAFAALLLTRRAYAQPGAGGAPDWSLLLDRALGLDDALPAYLEGKGDFRAPLGSRIATALDATKEKQAAPKRQFVPLAVALILALFPLVSWLPDPRANDPAPSEVAKQTADNPAAMGQPTGNAPIEPAAAEDDGDEDGSETGEGSSGGGDEGKVERRPDGSKTEGGAGTPPEDVKPEPMKTNPKPNEGGTGNNTTPPTDGPKPEDKDVPNDLTKIKPVAGDGETRTENRSRWVYNPDGKTIDESTPVPPGASRGDERAMLRTKITSSERKRIEDLYRKLYE